MNIVDSSAWLEYFAGTKNASNFANIIENTASLLVPSVILYEVFKKNLSEKDNLPIADSIILATAMKHNATVWTQDSDFKGIENVKYFQKQ